MQIRKIWLSLTALFLFAAAGLYVLFLQIQPSDDPWAIYDRQYFEEIQPGSTGSAARVVPELIYFLSPKSLVDVGCEQGAWLAEFERHGIADVFGIDGPWVEPQVADQLGSNLAALASVVLFSAAIPS